MGPMTTFDAPHPQHEIYSIKRAYISRGICNIGGGGRVEHGRLPK